MSRAARAREDRGAVAVVDAALRQPCPDADALHAWLRQRLGIDVPRHAVCPGHDAPFDYLAHAYFEPASDTVVWAPRGGGKTRLAAAASLLDLLHKAPCALRIVGGSLEQSLRMWEHLLPDLQRLLGEALSARSRSPRRVDLACGSSAAVLAQSQRAVRGLRVQKLRCDEVELFRPDVWEAAQLATRSTPRACGAIEALSTFHLPGGLMRRILDDADRARRRVIRWCVMEVLERCPAARDCGACPLWEECQGRAKTMCDGFLGIDDAIAMKRRVSRETWEAEMLCRRPLVRGGVFPSWDESVHVVEAMPPGSLHLAIDFGFANPFVCLWIVHDGRASHVVDEYVQARRTVQEHVEQILRRGHGRAQWAAADPAGAGRNEQTAVSSVAVLRAAGLRVRARRSRIVDGLEQIRAALRPASGSPTLFVHPRCARLREALASYRYGDDGGELPLKDGRHDHLIDALRYYFANLSDRPARHRAY